MLPKKNRLDLKKSYSYVAVGKRVEGANIKLFYRFSDSTWPLVGISTSAKMFKKAVDRNRARRLLSAAFENLYQKLPKSINIVALPKSGILKMGSSEAVKEVEELISKFQSPIRKLADKY